VTVNEVINHFGSIRTTAEALGLKFQAVHNWKQKGFVPEGRQWQIQAITAGALTVDKEIRERAGSAA
jgi:hypothetical protein